MAKLAPVSQGELVRKLRKLGFEGPVQRGKHPYMIRGSLRLIIPNPHRGQISQDLLTKHSSTRRNLSRRLGKRGLTYFTTAFSVT
ncbi:MAG TPA: type II toxin-antitoxin system HicA family toxin [Bryobacteraceae bacterium]|nr:type II toxin-antitoxin system HicA family toxin [Bryobacteraceae bacterium]